MQVKPKPCPNCGSKYVEMWTKFFGSNGFEVRCLDCGYIGELGKTRAAAVRAWNNDERRKKNAGLYILLSLVNCIISILVYAGADALAAWLGG